MFEKALRRAFAFRALGIEHVERVRVGRINVAFGLASDHEFLRVDPELLGMGLQARFLLCGHVSHQAFSI